MNIRILTYNIHKGIGWGVRKSTLNQIHDQLQEHQPDIILLQEVRGSQFELLASEIWPHFSYGKNAVYPKGHHGNAILSKFPISYSDNIDLSMSRHEHRGLLHSIIKITSQKIPLHILCVHLGLLKKYRKKQLDRIVEYIQQNIPEHEGLALGGDFNDWSGSATKILKKELDLHEAFLSSHGACARTFPAWAPVLRLDRLYYRGMHINRAHRLIHEPWKYLSDHIALELEISIN